MAGALMGENECTLTGMLARKGRPDGHTHRRNQKVPRGKLASMAAAAASAVDGVVNITREHNEAATVSMTWSAKEAQLKRANRSARRPSVSEVSEAYLLAVDMVSGASTSFLPVDQTAKVQKKSRGPKKPHARHVMAPSPEEVNGWVILETLASASGTASAPPPAPPPEEDRHLDDEEDWEMVVMCD